MRWPVELLIVPKEKSGRLRGRVVRRHRVGTGPSSGVSGRDLGSQIGPCRDSPQLRVSDAVGQPCGISGWSLSPLRNESRQFPNPPPIR